MAYRTRFPRACPALAAILLASLPVRAGPAQDAAGSGEAFGVDLYQRLSAKQGNVFLSPYSISEALALLSTGASGRTREEILTVLHWSRPAGEMPAAFAAQDLLLGSAAADGAALSTANGLWYQQGGEPLAPFMDEARTQFRAEVRPVDFAGNSGGVAPEINDWVAGKTQGKITDLFPPGSLSRSTRLVLANAVYFKGAWTKPFEPRETQARPFFTGPGQSTAAPMMGASEHLRLAETAECDLLELPYRGGSLSMVVLLPKARDGMRSLEHRLTPGILAAWLAAVDAARPRQVAVRLPRFKVVYSEELTGLLQLMGMADAFSPGEADLSGIDGRRDLVVSAVRHKAFVEVNEQGTEAAAATGVGVVALAVEMSERFFADHPFLFVIRDSRSGTILFLGRVSDPTKT